MKLSILVPGISLLSISGFAHKQNIFFIPENNLPCALGCYGDPIAKTPHLDRLAITEDQKKAYLNSAQLDGHDLNSLSVLDMDGAYLPITNS